MKTKLEMAHDYLRDIVSNWEYDDSFNPVAAAWQYADAMQAEADKREKEEVDKQSAELRNILKLSKFKPLELQPDLKELQPDWSQAPDDATAWEYLGHNSARWHTTTKGMYKSAELFGFSGVDMLILKRPQ